MTDEQKEQMIAKIMHDFDFEKVHAFMLIMDWTYPGHDTPTIEKLRENAEKILRRTLEYEHREEWWMERGGLFSYIDNRGNLYLAFTPERARARRKEVEL